MNVMHESAIEREVREMIRRFKESVGSRDRGVVWGLLLAMVPFPPVAMIGFLISLFNLWLWKNDKLDYSEGFIIKFSIVLSLCMFVASSALFYFFASEATAKFPHIFHEIVYRLDTALKAVFAYIGDLLDGAHQGSGLGV